MDSANLQGMVELGFGIIGIFNAVLSLRIRSEVQGLRQEMTEKRLSDGQEIRAWVDDAFARQETVNARIETQSVRITALESM